MYPLYKISDTEFNFQSKTNNYLAAYTSPIAAILLTPGYDDSSIWSCEGSVNSYDGYSAECISIRSVEKNIYPTISPKNRLRICAGSVLNLVKDKVILDAVIDWYGGRDSTLCQLESYLRDKMEDKKYRIVSCFASAAKQIINKEINGAYLYISGVLKELHSYHKSINSKFDLVSIAESVMYCKNPYIKNQ